MEEVVTGESDDQKRHLPFPSVKILHIGFHLYSWSAQRTRRTNAVKIKEKTMKPEGQQNKICLF